MTKHRVLYTITQRVKDDEQNQIIIREDSLTRKRLKIGIKLRGEDRERSIASVDLEKKVMYMKREHQKHFHFTTNSYGFNWMLLKDSIGWETLLLTVELPDGKSEEYRIPRTVLMEKGYTHRFSGKGFEVQKFVPIDVLSNYRVAIK